MSFSEYSDRYVAQIEALNALVLESMESIIEADPQAVIVLTSDHGTRYSQEDEAEQWRVLLAARTPGSEGALFAQDQSTVNILRDIVRTYFEVDAPRLEHQGWSSEWYFDLRLTRVE